MGATARLRARLGGLFDRYALTHLEAAGAPLDLRDAAGAPLGRVERLRLGARTLEVAGWARADLVTLSGGALCASTHPALPRPDLPDGAQGFAFRLRRPLLPPGESLALTLAPEGAPPVAAPLPLPDLDRARARLRLPFALALLRALPHAARWRLTGDPGARAAVKRALAIEPPAPGALLRPAQLAPPSGAPPTTPVTVVLPVFNALDLLRLCLDRLESGTDLPWRLVAVEDASTDPAVRPFLQAWAEARPDRVTLLLNDANLGFVGSANRGLAAALPLGRPVVLLNSDALLPPAWASRLLAPLLADPSVATVTPLSNDAEIATAPVACAPHPLPPGAADRADAFARRLDPLAATAEAPTGVGFCMALSPAFLRRLPGFDPAFGRGYGEEVDWCQKARALGGRHLATAALFVEHRGGTSFGPSKARLVAAHNALVARRHPAFPLDVQAFLADDPLVGPRLLLGLALMDATVPLYLGHSLGGGAELDLRRRVLADVEALGAALVLRVGGERRWALELHAPGGATVGWTDDDALLRRLLAPLGRRRIVYSCGVGDADPLALPALLLSLRDGAEEASVEVLVHDYFPVSPSYTLLDSRGRFRGPVVAGAPGSGDRAHRAWRPGGGTMDLAAWQDAWRPLMIAGEVTAFSEAAALLVRAAYPDARVRVRPHAPLAPVPPLPRPAGPRVVAALGNLGAPKGALLLAPLARHLAAGGARLAVLGNLDPALPPPEGVEVTGGYALADLPALAARLGVTDWIVPSVWPETFSFTTREALATGLPTYAFALGAQGEAVARAPNGMAVPFDPDADLALALARAILARA